MHLSLSRILRRLTRTLALGIGTLLAASAHASNCPTTRGVSEILNSQYTNDTLVLAHRGLWGKYAGNTDVPENSLDAIREANNKCMDGIELDVKMTKDGVAILMHDYNLGRTTDINSVIGGKRYDPQTNSGQNPKVSDVTWGTVSKLNLLTPSRSGVHLNLHPERLEKVITYWRDNKMITPLIFDVKTADAVRAWFKAANNTVGHAANCCAVKVNATLYPKLSDYQRDAPDTLAIPVYTTNMLTKINMDDSMNSWQAAGTFEINVKQKNGLLQGHMNHWMQKSHRIGVFQAIPDGPGNGQFYNSDGHCCYKLSSLYFSYSGGKDTADNRGDINYLIDQGFGLITTDDPVAAMRTLNSHGRRKNHYVP